MELLLEVPLIQDHSQDDECLLISYISAKEFEFDTKVIYGQCILAEGIDIRIKHLYNEKVKSR